MSDSFGDGWTGNNWTGFGRTYTIKGAKKQKSVNFVVGGGSSKASVTDVMDKEAAAIGTAPVNATSVAPPEPTAPVPQTAVPVVEVPAATNVAPATGSAPATTMPVATDGYVPVGPATTTTTVHNMAPTTEVSDMGTQGPPAGYVPGTVITSDIPASQLPNGGKPISYSYEQEMPAGYAPAGMPPAGSSGPILVSSTSGYVNKGCNPNNKKPSQTTTTTYNPDGSVATSGTKYAAPGTGKA